MDLTHLIYFLIIGLCAGWIAGMRTQGRGFGLVGNLIIGVAGAVVGGSLFGLVPAFLKDLILATVGALLFLSALQWLNKNGSGRRRRR